MNFNIKAEQRKPDARVYILTFQKKQKYMQIDFKSVFDAGWGGRGVVIACKEAEENSLRQWKYIQGYIRLAKLIELYSKNNALYCMQTLAQ